MKYFSMFTGIGGFELGIQRSYNNKLQSTTTKKGLQDERGDRNADKQKSCVLPSDNTSLCIGYSEIDKYSIQTYEKNFKGHKNYGDATKIKPEELPDFDMLCGGFPCQAFSIAGKRKGFEDTRGTLFFDIERILKVKRPKIVFLENVKGLLSHEKGETFRVIISRLEALGYNTQWMVFNSKFFGVPQNRERVFIIGSLRGECRPEILPFRQSSKETSEINQINNPTHSNDRVYSGEGISPSLNTMQGGNRQPKVMRHPLRFLSRNQKNIEGDYAYTVDSANTGGVKVNYSIRRLTPVECERLQGFPDNWTEGVSDTQRYKQCGNAVTVNVIEAISKKLLPSLSG